MEIIRQKVLQVSVWHHDALQENNFLGGISIPLAEVALDKETTDTYTLGNLTM
jgi:phosphatidylinositol-4-phosphate 3-kinase